MDQSFQTNVILKVREQQFEDHDIGLKTLIHIYWGF